MLGVSRESTPEQAADRCIIIRYLYERSRVAPRGSLIEKNMFQI